MMRGTYFLTAAFLAGTSLCITVTVSPGDAIQDSLETLVTGDTLYLSPGTYTDSSGQPLLQCGPLQAGVTILSDPLNRAVLNGQGMERPVISLTGPFSSPVILGNLVVTGGNATGGGFFNGGGISCSESWVSIGNCLITDNSALIGGGIGAAGGTLQVQYSTISNNQALVTGGGIDIYACEFTGFVIWFESNESSDDGGGLNCYQSTVQLESAAFTGNFSGDDGGGICILQGTSSLEYITMHGNEAFDDGGGIRIHTIDSLWLASSVITSNLGKAGVNVISDIKPTVSHVCCWNNEYANYNGMEDPTGTSGNISADPLFADGMLNISQTAAGQPENSPALDAAHEPVSESQIITLSTRTDSLPDTGTADMGFHHVNLDQSGTDPESGTSNGLIFVCPSPVTTFSTLTVSGITGPQVELTFFELTGRIVKRVILPVQEGNRAVYAVPDEFPDGLILVMAVWNEGAATGRMLIAP